MDCIPSAKSATLAILPFENLGASRDLDYFCKGLVEELIVDLSHFSALQIISSYTSSRLSDPDVDMIAAARGIDIDYMLKGSIYLQEKAIRLNTQLLETTSGKILWAERFAAPLDELFTIQENIVERVVYSISAEVDHNTLTVARDKPFTNLAAYDCWLRGMDRLRLGTLEAGQEARDFFNQALVLDPHYSRAYVGLSLSHFNEWTCQLWGLFDQSEKSAFSYAVKAFKLDEGDHLVQMILGRIYLYRRQFDQAEHHIGRSLELNGNDADTLVQLASCMAFLGRAADGERLFQKAIRLNPYRNLWYYQYGSLAYFVQRKFLMSTEMALKRQLVNVWVDLPGYIAAAYAHLGESEPAAKFAALFAESFITSITRGRTPPLAEVLDWLRQANPFKYRQDEDCLIDGLVRAGLEEVLVTINQQASGVPRQKRSTPSPAIFKQEQAVWRLEFEGVEVTMPDLKGLHDLAKLMATPENELHCTDLMGAEASMDENAFTIDEKARLAYAQHIKDLQEEIDDAEECNDIGRGDRLRLELEQLRDHLSQSLGIGGRPRKLKSTAERARAAVTLRIRGTIKKIAVLHPSLGKHLSNSIRTGVFCSYSPEDSRDWILH